MRPEKNSEYISQRLISGATKRTSKRLPNVQLVRFLVKKNDTEGEGEDEDDMGCAKKESARRLRNRVGNEQERGEGGKLCRRHIASHGDGD